MSSLNTLKSNGRSGIVKSGRNKALDIFVFLAILAALVCLLPMMNVAATSLSSELAIINRRVFIWPVDLIWKL